MTYFGWHILSNDPAHFLDLINQSQALFEEIGDKNRIGDCLQFLGNRETDLQKRMQISSQRWPSKKKVEILMELLLRLNNWVGIFLARRLYTRGPMLPGELRKL